MFRTSWSFLKAVIAEWDNAHAGRMAAAMAFHTFFSLTPLLVIAIAVAGFFFGEEAARNEIAAQMQGLIGSEGAMAVQALVRNASTPREGVLASSVGMFVLLLGASNVFRGLQGALNTIWDVRPRMRIKRFVTTRLISFGIVLGTGFLLLVSLLISAALSALGRYSMGVVPFATSLWQTVNIVVSLAIISGLFGLIFKHLPDARIHWRDVLGGAIVTALFFTVGKYLIGLYLGNSGISSTYGAAGSLVVLLLWIYYSAQIILFGACFTRAYAKRYGSQQRTAANPH